MNFKLDESFAKKNSKYHDGVQRNLLLSTATVYSLPLNIHWYKLVKFGFLDDFFIDECSTHIINFLTHRNEFVVE